MNLFSRLYFLCIVLLACCSHSQAQELAIGDTLPSYTFNSVLRYSSPQMDLSRFRGKVLVLVLWRTTCGHSIATFSHFDSLQRQFGDQVMVMAVTTEDRQTIEHYFNSNVVAKQTALPTVTNDTVLAGKRFPFIFIPHVVVADAQGIIRAITYPEKVTAEAVRKLLAGQPVHLPLKKEVPDFDFSTPVLLEGGGRNVSSLVYTSVITHALPGVMHEAAIDTGGNRVFYKAYNKTIPELYAQALHFTLIPNRLVLEVKDTTRFILPAGSSEEAWDSSHRWVYNLILPKQFSSPEQFALQDFDRFFGVHASVEQRKVKCLLLVKKGKGERWKTKGGDGYLNENGAVTYIHNTPIHIVASIWDYLSPLPVINTSGLFDERVDMETFGTPASLEAFRENLRQYDLDLVPAERKISVLVIKKAL